MEILDNTNPQHFLYAGFWRRFLAMFIDSLILGLVSSIVFSNSQFKFSSDEPFMVFDTIPLFYSFNLLGGIASFILNLIYYAALESSKYQATLGKMAMGIKVIDADGNRLSSQKAIVRYVCKIISAIILFIGYIMAAFDSKKQALHDKIADTLVIKIN
ncbi:MAG: RDD family protein [Bacteroidetes bacterium]|nr:RDD family protein [Bacteroidota bacterium]